MTDYANPQSLVSTDWVEKNRKDDSVVIVEVDVDTSAYEEGHIPGAVGWNWKTQLADRSRRDILGLAELEELLGKSGIDNKTIVVLYGDNNNWFAAWAFWQLKVYGHQDVRILNGGRKKWIAEGREIVTEIPSPNAKTYKTMALNQELRALLPQVKTAVKGKGYALVDVRSPDEFTGKLLAPAGLPETCQRGGHIPGARSIPWGLACNEDGTFKPVEELRTLYAGKGVTPDKEVIAYCRIGERSSHSWFVLKHLLGYPNVKNYDGSWTEWGNLVGAPIEQGEEKL
ncbi:MAG: sulfurtransferase [Candidatus Krumholzibacteria bacterium]|nr:sulfurtransferase [Candidatus Krumholzibacteria bacterium]